mgnify:CR=1 FL=1
MEVTFVRVDSRLIHGQVSTAWVHHTGVNRLMVVNDKAAHDSMERALLNMAKPRNIRVLNVLTIKQAVEMIRNDTGKDKVMIIARTPHDVKGLVDGGVAITELNLGNMPPKEGKIKFEDTVYADEEEIAALKAMADAGISIYAQTTPVGSKSSLNARLQG